MCLCGCGNHFEGGLQVGCVYWMSFSECGTSADVAGGAYWQNVQTGKNADRQFCMEECLCAVRTATLANATIDSAGGRRDRARNGRGFVLVWCGSEEVKVGSGKIKNQHTTRTVNT